MFNLASNAVTTTATYGPSIFFGSVILTSLIGPSILKMNKDLSYGPTAKQMFPDLFQRVATLRDDIFLYSEKRTPYATGFGTSFGFDACIWVNPLFLETQGEAKNFYLKSAISDIRTNSMFIRFGLVSTASLISTYAVPRLASILPWWGKPIAYCIPFFVSMIVHRFALEVFNQRTHAFVLPYTTDQELQDFIIFLGAQIQVEIDTKYPKTATSDADLNYLLNLSKGQFKVLVDQVIDELKRRNISIPTSQSALFKSYKGFHKQVAS